MGRRLSSQKSGATKSLLPAAAPQGTLPPGKATAPAWGTTARAGRLPEPARNSATGAAQVRAAAAGPSHRGWACHRQAEVDGRIRQFQEMGFTREAAEHALATGLDMQRALDRLLQGGFHAPGSAAATAAAAAEPATPAVASQPSGGGIVPRGVWASPASNAGEEALAKSIAIEPTRATASHAGADTAGARSGTSETGGPPGDAEAPGGPGEDDAADVDWQILLGAQETALPVAAGVGLPELPRLGAASHSVEKASEAVLPLLRRMQPAVPSDADGVKVPPQPIARAWSDWSSESPTDQLCLCKGGLVHLWENTDTELGWVYAESLCAGGLSGWVPLRLLRKLPECCSWMRTVRACDAMGENRLAVAEGEVLLVSTASATEAGWVHAERCDGSSTGWLPLNALGQLPPECQWLRIVQTFGASYKGQLATSDGSQVLVDPETRTADGWVYAWGMDTEDQSGTRQGWVPAVCLQWPED